MNSGRFAVKLRATRLRRGQGLYGGNKMTPCYVRGRDQQEIALNDQERANMKWRNAAHVLNEKEVVGLAQLAV